MPDLTFNCGTYSYHMIDFPTACEEIAEGGFDGVYIHLLPAGKPDRQAHRKIQQGRTAMIQSGLSPAVLFGGAADLSQGLGP